MGIYCQFSPQYIKDFSDYINGHNHLRNQQIIQRAIVLDVMNIINGNNEKKANGQSMNIYIIISISMYSKFNKKKNEEGDRTTQKHNHCVHVNGPNIHVLWTDFYFPNKAITT